MQRYCMGSKAGFEREGLQLGFAAIEPKQIKDGVRELAAALESLPPGKKVMH